MYAYAAGQKGIQQVRFSHEGSVVDHQCYAFFAKEWKQNIQAFGAGDGAVFLRRRCRIFRICFAVTLNSCEEDNQQAGQEFYFLHNL